LRAKLAARSFEQAEPSFGKSAWTRRLCGIVCRLVYGGAGPWGRNVSRTRQRQIVLSRGARPLSVFDDDAFGVTTVAALECPFVVIRLVGFNLDPHMPHRGRTIESEERAAG